MFILDMLCKYNHVEMLSMFTVAFKHGNLLFHTTHMAG